MLRLTITDPNELHQVDGEIHDWFYDVDDVHLDSESSELVVPFRRWDTEQAKVVPPSLGRPTRWLTSLLGTEWETPWYRWTLRVREATGFDLVDEAEVGSCDFNGIGYDTKSQVVTIEGNIPVTITVAVRRLAVSVEETDEIVGVARYTTWPGGAESYTGNVLPAPEARQ